MKEIREKYVQLARYHGAQARLNAARIPVMLTFFSKNPSVSLWLLKRAINASKLVAHHLKHTTVLSRAIKKHEQELIFYQDYKGVKYEFLGEAKLHSNTEIIMVLYKGPRGSILTLPKKDFFAVIDYRGNIVPRFQEISF
jgi:hypothetical protein